VGTLPNQSGVARALIKKAKARHQHLWKVSKQYRVRFGAALSRALKLRIKTSGALFAGRKHTLKTKKLIGEKSRVHQQGRGNSQYGTFWTTNGTKNLRLKRGEPIPYGFHLGRTCRPLGPRKKPRGNK
jgi:hypothetical protein